MYFSQIKVAPPVQALHAPITSETPHSSSSCQTRIWYLANLANNVSMQHQFADFRNWSMSNLPPHTQHVRSVLVWYKSVQCPQFVIWCYYMHSRNWGDIAIGCQRGNSSAAYIGWLGIFCAIKNGWLCGKLPVFRYFSLHVNQLC